jgi:hypothetical protein
VGNNGETLVADSSTSTGLRYQAPVQQNPVLNSAFQVWQRGTSFTNCSSVYTADRWYSFTYGVTTGRTVSRQLTGDTTNLPNIQYCVRIARNNADTNTSAWQFFNPWETLNSVQLAGKTITFSFYARKGANYSATSSILRSLLTYGTGTDQNPINGYTGGTDAIDQNNTLTTTWQRFTATATLPGTVTEISTNFIWTPTGTAGAADYVEITGVQVEVGSVATPFHTYAATIQGELAACQRYYATSIPTGFTITDFPIMGTSGAGGQIFWATGTSDLFGSLQYPVPLRTTPTFTAYSGNNRTAGNARDMTTGTDIVFTPAPQAGNNRLLSYVTVGATATSGRPYGFQWTASAEL